MTSDNLLSKLPSQPVLMAAGVAVLLALLAASWLLRRKSRGKLARRLTTAATVLGLGWSAQGMWDTAVHHYKQDAIVASVLFVVFEAMLSARMLKAHQYRADYARRPKLIASVWVFASVMAFVVAAGEGIEQAPARLSIPLLVAYGWYIDLTADDDPADKPKTSWRWTARRLGLALGAIEGGERDIDEINRDRLRNQMTSLAFREHHGDKTLNGLLHRKTRLQRLQTLADDADIAAVRARLARSRVDLMTTEPVQMPEPLAPPRITVPRMPAQRPLSEAGRLGVHERDGRTLRGEELRQDAIAALLASVTADLPTGMTTEKLRSLYTPPLGQRTAEKHAGDARKLIRTNGHAFTEA